MENLNDNDLKIKHFTPREIVSELDRYIIGQKEAKRAVAIALRNRWRRQQVDPELKEEIAPKNIIMIGTTGVGKTEIARRLANLSQAPFIKVEASKFTEVGYVGRDVESMVRDLVELSVKMVKDEEQTKVQTKAKEVAEEKLLDLLLPSKKPNYEETDDNSLETEIISDNSTREKLRIRLREGKMDDRYVDMEVQHNPIPNIKLFTTGGIEEMDMNISDMLGNIFPSKTKKRKVKIPEALEILKAEEAQKLIDMDKVIQNSLKKVEQSGIIFIDEIDKIAGRGSSGRGPDVSREGVQRDLLPIIEGSTVTTKHGMIKTDHILFIAAGAFHVAKPSDLVPELQGRFPIRVELNSLDKDDFIKILTEPKNSLVKQYVALMKTEDIKLDFTKDAIEEIAGLSEEVNKKTENIGARRLHTVMEKILDEISFDAPDMSEREISIDAKYITDKLADIIKDEDLSRYIL